MFGPENDFETNVTLEADKTGVIDEPPFHILVLGDWSGDAGKNDLQIVFAGITALQLQASGASKIKIDGEAKTLETNSSGASGIDAENLVADNAKAEASGASSVTVNAVNNVEAIASGASTVTYAGNPKNITQNSSGASTIKKK